MGQFPELYNNKRWHELRRKQLYKQPLCERCLSRDTIAIANVVHHKIPHKGDRSLFYSSSNLASSCYECHNVDEQRIEKGGRARQAVDIEGWPK